MKAKRVVCLALTGGLLAACSTAGRLDKVIPDMADITVKNRHAGSVYVRVAGGDDSFVSTDTFAKALVQGLNESRVFESVSLIGSGDYELRVMIKGSSKTFLGGECWTNSRWQLRSNDGKMLWESEIKRSGTSMDFGGAARIRKSAERASRAVIEAGIKALAELEL